MVRYYVGVRLCDSGHVDFYDLRTLIVYDRIEYSSNLLVSNQANKNFKSTHMTNLKMLPLTQI